MRTSGSLGSPSSSTASAPVVATSATSTASRTRSSASFAPRLATLRRSPSPRRPGSSPLRSSPSLPRSAPSAPRPPLIRLRLHTSTSTPPGLSSRLSAAVAPPSLRLLALPSRARRVSASRLPRFRPRLRTRPSSPARVPRAALGTRPSFALTTSRRFAPGHSGRRSTAPSSKR